MEWGNTCETPEMQTLEQLLQAYDEEDRESAKRALASPFIRSMDVEYARLAASIPLPEGIDPIPRATVREKAAPSYVSANVAKKDVQHGSSFQTPQSEPEKTQDKKTEEEDDLC